MKLISTKDYLLLIDEVTGFKSGDWNYEIDNTIQIYQFSYDIEKYPGNKIMAYYPLSKEAEELDLPLLPNPFKEEIDIEELALKEYPDGCDGTDRSATIYRRIFVSGYKAAQAKQFSLEDVENILIRYLEEGFISKEQGYINPNSFLKSLSAQQLPKEFIPEWQWKCPLTGVWLDKPDLSVEVCKEKRIKRKYIEILKQELVGTYKY